MGGEIRQNVAARPADSGGRSGHPSRRRLNRLVGRRKSLRWSSNASVRAGLLAGLLFLGGTPATAFEVHDSVLTRAEWPRQMNGANVLALPVVAQVLRRFSEDGGVVLVIRYPGGDSGRRWAGELRGWLVGFGVPTRYIELQPGSGGFDRLVVSVIERD